MRLLFDHNLSHKLVRRLADIRQLRVRLLGLIGLATLAALRSESAHAQEGEMVLELVGHPSGAREQLLVLTREAKDSPDAVTHPSSPYPRIVTFRLKVLDWSRPLEGINGTSTVWQVSHSFTRVASPRPWLSAHIQRDPGSSSPYDSPP